jgi:NAD(P)-dependent dehydrogenase (short-subunit alcohol dehydrogenase family)
MTSPTYDYTGTVVLVTGAASGIGAASAHAFAAAGARVALWDRDADRLADTYTSLPGDRHCAWPVDVSDREAVDVAFEELVEHFGGLDVAHNNAGMELPRAQLADIDEVDFDRALSVNLKSVWLCMRREVPLMLGRGGGAIVNTASVTSALAVPMIGAYATAKHGVLGLTRTAALEYAEQGIRVNAVIPGATRTGLLARRLDSEPEMESVYAAKHPIGRVAEADEVAQAVLWLCSDASAFVVGHGLAVDGGWAIQ